MPYVLINFVRSARGVIFGSVGLYFLGVLPVNTLNWGVVLQRAYTNGALSSSGALHWIVVPMATIVLLSAGFILFAQGADNLFNARLRDENIGSL